MSVLDKPRLATHALGKGVLRIRRFFNSASTSLTGLSSLVPERISKAPPDLRTSDAMLAQEFYNGRYVFGGHLYETKGKSPFHVPSQGKSWDCELNSFEWLRHLSASSDVLTANHARSLISDWIELHKKTSNVVAWDIEITSRRLIAWLCNSILIVSNSDHAFHELFMRIIGNHIRFLKRELPNAPDGMPRLYAAIALAYASICHDNESNPLQSADEKLGQELALQILPDGGHISRNPAYIIDLLLVLLPLKQAFDDSNKTPSAELQKAINRMFPALRFFKMGDSSIGRFNGVSHVEADYIAAVLRHDETGGLNIDEAEDSQFQRLVYGDSIFLMDTGPAPRGELSTKAHAGCLSFEFSHGTELIICNAGAPKYIDDTKPADWRMTDAHSTVTLNDTPSCKFETSGTLGKFVGGQIYSAPLKPEAGRDIGEDYMAISAAHHGYVRDFSIRHQRNVILDINGKRLSGNDWFTDANKGDLKANTKDVAHLRFHLAPHVKASLASDGQSVVLQTRGGGQWAFSCPGFKVELESGTYYAGIAASTQNWQIVIRARVATTPEIKWVLQKLKSD